MSEQVTVQMNGSRGFRLAWVFVALALIVGGALFYGGPPAGASEDHDEAHELRLRGDVLPLAEIIDRAGLGGQRVIEADLERDDGRLVYELEVLDADGRVSKRYFDASSGEALGGHRED
jgi:uncharacterized membrane protein YkoI